VKMTLPATTLQRAVRAVACAVDDAGHQPRLAGILLRWDAATCTLSATATDSYRIHIATVPCQAGGTAAGAVAEWSALVPGDWLTRWAREAWWDTSGGRRKTSLMTTITLSNGRIKLATGDDERARPVLKHTFPAIQALLDEAQARGVDDGEPLFNPGFFADIVRSADVFARGVPMRVQAWHPEKPNRFVVATEELGRLEMLLMPMRATMRQSYKRKAA